MIKVSLEPKDLRGYPAEHCFNCAAPTRYWYVSRDVACCPDCARVIRPADVPTKRQWLHQNVHTSMDKETCAPI